MILLSTVNHNTDMYLFLKLYRVYVLCYKVTIEDQLCMTQLCLKMSDKKK